jgi:cytoskeletal protein CcmA (bactofilin family)
MRGFLRRIAYLFCIGAGLALSGCARQTEPAHHAFGGTVFDAGREVRIAEPVAKNLFAAGETVTVDGDVGDTAHIAARNVRVNRAVGGNLYVAGYDVDINGAVAGDVIAAGYRVEISSSAMVGKDVLAAARSVLIRGPVAGDASLAGQSVEVAAPVSGSAEIRAAEISFAQGARIGGTLEYWSDHEINVPASVIASDRVTAHIVERPIRGPGPAIAFIIGGIVFLILILLFTALFVWLSGAFLARTRELFFARPWRNLLLGVVATSALFGAILVFAVSLVGIPLVPLMILLIPLVLFAGYVTTAYAIGAYALERMHIHGHSTLATFGAIIMGVVILALIGTIPLLGWVIAVFAVVFGLGTWFALILERSRQKEAAAS